MRSTQMIGHTAQVSDFLNSCAKGRKIGDVIGMFEEHVQDLHEYIDEYGDVWEEYIEASPWSSGPMIFLGIKTNRGEFWEIKGWALLEDTRHETVDYINGTYYV